MISLDKVFTPIEIKGVEIPNRIVSPLPIPISEPQMDLSQKWTWSTTTESQEAVRG